jgi:hypothetical protein
MVLFIGLELQLAKIFLLNSRGEKIFALNPLRQILYSLKDVQRNLDVGENFFALTRDFTE